MGNISCMDYGSIVLVYLIVYVTIVTTSTGHSNNHRHCIQKGTTLTCDQHLPHVIPRDVTEVYVADYMADNIDSKEFDDPSWQNVTKLDIIINIDIHVYLKDIDVFPLRKLKYLGLHSPTLAADEDKSNYRAFTKLNQLTHLNLSNCQNLNSDVVATIVSTALPKLTSLDLKGLNTLKGHSFVLSMDFWAALQSKPIRWLSLSGTNLIGLNVDKHNKLPALEYLDISNSTLVFTGRSHKFIDSLLKHVKTLDISLIPGRFFILNLIINKNYTNVSANLPMLENIYMNNIIDKPLVIDKVTANLSLCQLSVKTLECIGNKIQKFNATIIWPQSCVQTMTYIDFSSNELMYLSQYVFNSLTKLTHLLLNNNSLYIMEYLPEMSEMFKTFSNLRHLALGHNHFTSLPYDVFLNNTYLQTLLLNGNNFNIIMFKLDHLKSLQVLDLRRNKIKFQTGEGLIQFHQLLQHMKNRTASFKPGIIFENNPLECTCESVEFLDWINEQLNPYILEFLTCNLEGRIIDINQNAIDKSKYLCHRSAILAGSCLSGLALLIILCVAVSVVKRYLEQRNINSDFQCILKDFNNKKLDVESVIYLSANDNDDSTLEYVYNQLNKALKAKYKISTNIICLGQVHFKNGYHVIDNIMHFVDHTLVTIFIISNAFCRNSECRMELKEAYMKEKPIILIFKEPIFKGLLDTYPYLYTVIHRSKTVKLDRVANEYKLVPCVNKIINNIARMSTMEHQQRQHQQSNEEKENTSLL